MDTTAANTPVIDWSRSDSVLTQITVEMEHLGEQKSRLERQHRAVKFARGLQPGQRIWTKEPRRMVRVASVVPSETASGIVVQAAEEGMEIGFDAFEIDC